MWGKVVNISKFSRVPTGPRHPPECQLPVWTPGYKKMQRQNLSDETGFGPMVPGLVYLCKTVAAWHVSIYQIT